jgi:glycosyltransferase involved in cell wall biosynthesis
VPAILEQAGLLERFYTDLAGNVGPGKWMIRIARLMGWRSAAERLAGRRIPDVIKPKTVCFGGVSSFLASNRVFGRRTPANTFRRHLLVSHALGRAMAQRGFGGATHFYSMLGECSPLLAAANQAGLRVVTEFYILLSSERIVGLEQRAFPNWSPALPDLASVRADFPDEQKIIARTDFAVCPSEAVRADLEGSFGFAKGRGAVVPYGLDAKWLALDPRPIPGRILFVGTAGLRKGIHYLAMAAAQLHESGRSYEFYVAGDLAPGVSDHPLCRHLRFLGRLPRSAAEREFLRADAFVLPSLAEGSAEAIYEALGAGLPVVTTAAAGSVVRDGREGFVVPERDAPALASAIERLVEHRQLRTQVSLAARARAREYTLDHYGERLVNALRSFQ